MGFDIAWVAVRGRDPDVLYADSGFAPTGTFEADPDSPVVGARLPTGWYLLYFNDRHWPDDALLAKLSRGGEVVYFDVVESTSYASASHWRDGRMQWCVIRDSSQGSTHLETEGKLPDSFAELREHLLKEQTEKGDLDYLSEIPCELAEELTGFVYYRDIAGEKPFERLERKPARKKRWWEFWKGRG